MKRPQKFETISHLIWHLLSKRQIKWEIASKFVAFLENLNFNFSRLNIFFLIFSKKATKFETISHIIWRLHSKSSGRLFQIFVAFSECPNFICSRKNKA